MFQSMVQHEYRAESHVTDRLERENAQLKAVIADQKNYPHVNDYIAQQYAEIQRLRGVIAEQKETVRQADLVLAEQKEQAELIEKMAKALNDANEWFCLQLNGYDSIITTSGMVNISGTTLAAYEDWKK